MGPRGRSPAGEAGDGPAPVRVDLRSRAIDLRSRADRIPLRVKLVAALMALMTVTLLVTGTAATSALRSYLVSRLDQQLADASAQLGGRPFDPISSDLSHNFYYRVSAPDGSLLQEGQLRAFGARPVTPPRLGQADLIRPSGKPFTVAAEGRGPAWRVLVEPIGGRTLAVALSLAQVRATVARLVRIEVTVGLTALLVLGAAGYAVIRRSLAPLADVERTAAAIARGDLSQRVTERDPRTEVGQLSQALNTMLGQIESAFRSRERSEAAARASEERMRRFVADASHELRTPLTSIRGFAELYRQGAVRDPEELTGLLRRIESESVRMGLLVDDLLLLARLDQQRPLEREPVDLLAIATEAVHGARAVAPEHPVNLEARGADAAVVTGDGPRLRQVLGNLLTNAVTHTPPGTPVTVRVGVEADAAVVEVADQGPGIAAEDSARVFERFYRSDRSRARGAGGSGLGLSIVAALVEAHGGRVSVDTAPGAGATFRVELPLRERAPAAG